MTVPVLCAAVTALLTGCTAEALPAWQGCPIGAQFEYGIRSAQLTVLSPVVEETTGGMFLDNREDVFTENEICVNNSSYEVPDTIKSTILDTMAEYNFETSFYVIDLETHTSFGYNPQNAYDSASTIKVAFALYLAKEIERGRLSLGDILTYEERHYATGSGSTQESVYGTQFTVKALFYRMIYNSDNVAYYMLAEYAGEDGFNEMVTSLGWEHTISAKDHWCDVTPQELAIIWQEIYEYKDTCDEGRLLWTYLTTNLYNEFEVEMPEYESAHKSGWGYNGYHESGIVFGARSYICVVMTGTGNKNNCLHRTIRNLDNLMIDYDTWLKNQKTE
ncbi:MAG: serine hydrolase [Clostridia bacterium]|nr:serine hydrolase [Clostridia bacterium]